MRLIDADKLRDKFISIADTSIWCAFCNEVNNAPTVDLSEHDAQIKVELLDKVESRLTNKDITQHHYAFDNILSMNGYYDLNYLYFREYVSAIIEELKAEVENE